MLIAMLESQFRYDNAVARVPAVTWPLWLQAALAPARAWGVAGFSVDVPVSLALLMSDGLGGVINRDGPACSTKQTCSAKSANCRFAL